MSLKAKPNFPKLSISNITLEKNNINIKAFFTEQETFLRKFANSNSRLSANAGVFFIVSAPISKNSTVFFPSNLLVDNKKRIQNIAGFFGLSNLKVLNWYETLKKRYPMKYVSMDKIFNTQAKTTKAEFGSSNSLRDLNFEVSIPIEESIYDRVDLSEIRVHAFAHINISTMIGSGDVSTIGRNIRSVLGIGGNLKSIAILKLQDGHLQPPRTKMILVKQNGEAYNGRFKRLAGMGFMSVGQNTPQRLTQKQALEKTISADYHIERALEIPTVNEEEQLHNKLKPSFSMPIMEEYPVKVEEKDEALYQPAGQAQKLITQKVKIANRTISAVITDTVHSVSTADKGSNIIDFKFDWESVIKNNINLGFLLETVSKKTKLSDIDSTLSSRTILAQVKVLQVIIKRYRLSEERIYANNVGSPKYKKSKTSETILIANKFPDAIGIKTDRASIYLSENRSTYGKKCLYLEDHELYSMSHQGKYSYEMEVVYQDNIAQYLFSLKESFSASLRKLDINLSMLSEPRNIIEQKDQYLSGDIRLADIESNLEALIFEFLQLLVFSGKIKNKAQYSSLTRNIRTATMQRLGGTVSGLIKFREKCNNAISAFEEFLKKSSVKFNRNELLGKKISSSSKARDNIIHSFSFDIPGYSTAIPNGKILANPSGLLATLDNSNNYFLNSESSMSLKVSEFSYKTPDGAKLLVSRQEILTPEDTLLAESKAIILEDSIRSNRPGDAASRLLNAHGSPFTTETVFGFGGVTLERPNSSGVFNSTENDKKNLSKTTQGEIQAGLGSVVAESLASSIPTPTGNKKILEQEELDKLKVVADQDVFLKKVIKALATINEGTSYSSSDNLNDKLFSQRAGDIKIGIADNSGEMNFENLSLDSLGKVSTNNVMVKIEKPSYQNEENCILVNNVFEASKAQLNRMVTQSGQNNI